MEKTIILIEYNVAKEMADLMGCSKTMVSLSLQGKRNSDLAKKIRNVALTQYGGIEKEPFNVKNICCQ